MSSLDRGLHILERIAQQGPIPFSVLQADLPEIPRASLARLLKELVALGYLSKNDSGYSCSDRMGIFACLRAPTRHDDLIARWQHAMQNLAEAYGISTILLERVGDVPICIQHGQSDYSPTMQKIGFRNHQINHIWRQALIAFAPELQKRFLHKHPEIKAIIAPWPNQGYADDDCSFRPDLRRLAFPLTDDQGICIGLLGIGGSRHQITDARLPELVQSVHNLIKERH